MEMIFNNYKLNDDLYDFTIEHNSFNGIVGKDLEKIVNIIKLSYNYKGRIIINGIEINKNNINEYKKKICHIRKHLTLIEDNMTVYEIMCNEVKKRNISLKDEMKKINDSLKIVGLQREILTRQAKTLSSYEKKQINLAKGLLGNPSVIIFEEPFIGLDKNNEKKLIMFLQKIKEQYNKTIIIVSNNSNQIYRYTSHLIIFKNNKIIIEGNTSEIFQRVDFMKRNRIEIPKLVEITYLAKKRKNVKIDYHKDVRDIIKDIYKHV